MKKLVSLLLAVCTCLFVGAMLTACGEKKHSHTYKTEWSQDETYHWHKCEGGDCSAVNGKAKHSFTDGVCVCGYEQDQGGDPDNVCQHDWERTVVSDATCTEDGLATIKCNNCQEEQEETIDNLGGHDEVVDEGKEATCMEDGLTEGKHCSRCKDVLVEQTKIDALGHIDVTDEAVPQTCTQDGLTEGKHCFRCKDVLVEQIVIPAGHDYGEWEKTKDPTQTEEGTLKRTCSANSEHTETVGLPILNESNYVITNESDYTVYTYNKDGKDFVVKVFVYEFELNATSDGYILVGYNGNSASVEIPSEYKDLSVVGVAEEVFANNTKLTSVIIPDSVKTIGFKAFYGCSSLKSIKVPFVGENVTGRGKVHFGYIFGAPNSSDNKNYVPNTLTEVTISGETVGYEAFRGLKYITKITILEGLTSIGHSAFSYCEGLKSITLPSTLKYVGSAFNNCYDLINVYYAGTVENWCNVTFDPISPDSSPFYYADWNLTASHFYMPDNDKNWYEVTEINIPETVTEIGTYQFYGFNSVTDFTIPNTITKIGYLAFKGCLSAYKEYGNVYYMGNQQNPYLVVARYKDTSITECEINENAKFILESAFSKCYYLTSIEIPGSIKTISDSAFYNCKALETVKINEGVTVIEAMAFSSCANITSITIPNTVTTIGNNAFYDCKLIESITLGEKITSIGSNAFLRCTNLKSVEIPSGVKCIESYTFSGCTGLANVTINEGVTAIKESAFSNCTNLTTVSIPNTIKSIASDAFNGCSNLKYYEDNSASYLGNETNNYVVLVKVKSTTNYSYSIASTTLIIGDSAFSDCSNVSSISIPTGVISIGNYAFNNCAKLSSITLPGSLKEIGMFAFSGCVKLKSITIPSSVENIGQSAFNNCSVLANVTISDGVKNIGSFAFQNCTSLTNITIPSSVEYVGWAPFSGCDNLVYNEYDNAYYLGNEDNPYLVLIKCKNKSITSCKVNADTKIIAANAFGDGWSGCANLTDITISSKSIKICDGAFENCTALINVYFTGSKEEWDKIEIGASNDYLISSTVTYNYVAE